MAVELDQSETKGDTFWRLSLGRTRFAERSQAFHFRWVSFEILKRVKAEGINLETITKEVYLNRGNRCCRLGRVRRDCLPFPCTCTRWDFTASMCSSGLFAFDTREWVCVTSSFLCLHSSFVLYRALNCIYLCAYPLHTHTSLPSSKFFKNQISFQHSVTCLHVAGL